jgi:hypothetical protein
MVELYVPQASDWINAYQGGKQARMTSDKNAATQRAGGLMASGDYAGAAAAVLPYDMATGVQIQKYGAEQEGLERRKGYGQQFAEGKGADAAKAAYSAGDWDEGFKISKALDAASEQQRAQVKANAERVAAIVAPLGDLPENDIAGRKAYIAQRKADLVAAGYSEQQVDGFEPTNANLATIYSQAMGLKDYLAMRERQAKPDWAERTNPDGSTTWVDRNSPEVAEPRGSTGPAPSGNTDADAVWRAAIQQESGGRPGVIGPDTAYGNAQGLTQMLPATAQAMAEKLGVAWRPELMTAATPEAAAYQEQLGRAYFDEGLQKYGGDVRKALAYYHGGPDERIWGPKTAAHVNAVMARVQPGDMGGSPVLAGGSAADEVRPYQVAANGATPAPPSGRREIAGSAPQPKPQSRPATAAEKALYGIPADVPAQIKPDGSIDTISVGNGRGSGKLAPQDSKDISEARTAAQQLAGTLPLVNRFIQLNEDVSTGGMMGNSLVAGARAMVDPKVAEMKAITDKLTPAMRQGLPGAASDRDIAMFQSATVGLGKPGPANQSVAVAMRAATKRQQDYVAYLEDYARKNGSLLGAQEEWDAYAAANPMFNDQGSGVLKLNKTTPWREYFGSANPAASGQAPAITGAQAKALRAEASAAIKAGAPRAAVIDRLRQSGVTNVSGL